jgi:hypothetical protein
MIIEYHLRGETNVTKNQFDFMLERSTMKTILLIRQLIKRYRKKKDMYVVLVFVDLENAYNKVTSIVICGPYRDNVH